MEDNITNIGIPLGVVAFGCFVDLYIYIYIIDCIKRKEKVIIWSFQTSLLCIVGDLLGRVSVAVAVGVFLLLCHILSVSVYFGIGATIHPCQEINCLPDAFSLSYAITNN